MSQIRPATILVTDDDPGVLQVVSSWLTRQGYEVCCAATIEQALEMAQEQQPDLVLLDILFPQSNGFTFLEQLRAMPGLHDVPVIFMTASGSSSTRVAALQRGAQDYIAKPFAPDELLARVQAQLRTSRALKALVAEQRKTALLYDIARNLAGSLDLEDLLQRIVANTVSAVDATHGTLILTDRIHGPRISTASRQGIGPGSDTTMKVLSEGLAGWVLRHGSSVLIADVHNDPRWLPIEPALYPATSVLAVPLHSDPESEHAVDGVLTVSHEQAGAFSSEDLSLLEAVADQAATAIKQARLHQHERRRAAQLATLVEIAASINRVQDLDEALHQVSAAAIRLLETDYAAVELIEPLTRHYTVRAVAGLDDAGADHTMLQDARRSLMTFQQGGGVTAEDVLALADVAPEVRASAIRSMICAPLFDRDGQVIGVLSTGRRSPYSHTTDDCQLLTLLAQQTSVVIQNNSLYSAVAAERLTLQAVLTSAREGFIVADTQGRGQLINPAASRALDLAPESFIGRHLADLPLPAELRAPLLAADASYDLQLDLKGRNYHVLVSPVDRAGTGAVAVLIDITHFKALDLLRSQFVSTASHDLKSPLSIIVGYAQALQIAGPLNDKQQHIVRRIEQTARRLVALISDLLDLSSLDAGVRLTCEPCDLHGVIGDMVEDYTLRAAEKGIDLQFDLAPMPLVVHGNRLRLRQVFDNLLINALKYTPTGGAVRVTARAVDGQALVQIQDDGVGMAEHDLTRVFERFYRVQTSQTNDVEGTGLGLSIVKTIVETHGGHVWAESELGKGSTFSVSLPLV